MKPRILFVDDDASLLCGMKRSLYPLRQEWEMTFVQDGRAALAHLAQAPVDVLVSDMRMPGMDGPQLLAEVAKQRPQVVRIILSGQASRDSVLRVIPFVHQYLTKPCDAEVLKATVSRTLALRQWAPNETVTALVTGLAALPSWPPFLVAVTEALREPHPSLFSISQFIGEDIGMSAKILQIVNSALVATPHRVGDVAQAVSLLGADALQSLVCSQRIFFPRSDFVGRRFALDTIWDRSFLVASYAKRFAQMYAPASSAADFSDMAFTAGMLHDCGAVALAMTAPEPYAQARRLAREQGVALWKAEQQVLGVTHADVGAYLLGLWGLPDPIVEAVRLHHEPARSTESAFSVVTAVHVASVVAALSIMEERQGPRAVLDCAYLGQLGLPDRLSVWQDEVR
jgi:HD-like signal output (HDOD) protein